MNPEARRKFQKLKIFPRNGLLAGVLILLISTYILAQAQNDYPRELNLEDAEEMAINNSPLTKMSNAGIEMADAKMAEAGTGKKPFITVTQTFVRSNNPVFVFGSKLEQGRFSAANFAIESLNHPKSVNNFRTSIGFQMPLFDQYQTASRVEQANLRKEQANQQLEFVRQQIRFEVIRNFYGVVLAKERRQIAAETIKVAEANVKKTQDLVDVGMVVEADLLSARVQMAEYKRQLVEAESELITSTSALNITLGVEPDVGRFISVELVEKYFPVEKQSDLIKLALQHRADYQKAELAVTSSEEQIRSVNDTKLPRVDLFGNAGYSTSNFWGGSGDYTIGASVSYTLFDAGRKARLEQAVIGETMAQAEKEILARQISLEVVKTYQKFISARECIKVSIKTIEQAEEVMRVAQDRYNNGLTTITEILRAENALSRAKFSLLAARYDYYVSYAAILLATGQLRDVRLFK
jgi:outer membrane protein TolC